MIIVGRESPTELYALRVLEVNIMDMTQNIMGAIMGATYGAGNVHSSGTLYFTLFGNS